MTHSPATVSAMREAAGALLSALRPDQLASATAPFDTPDHRGWTYLPGPRPGLSLREMDDGQRGLAMTLLRTGLSAQGMTTARDIMALEAVLAELERSVGKRGWERRHPGHFWVRLLGVPDAGRPWAWRVNGHHLAVHLTARRRPGCGHAAVLRRQPGGRPAAARTRACARCRWRRTSPATWSGCSTPGSVRSPWSTRSRRTTSPPGATRWPTPTSCPEAWRTATWTAPSGGPSSGCSATTSTGSTPALAAPAWQAMSGPGLPATTFAWAGGLEPRRRPLLRGERRRPSCWSTTTPRTARTTSTPCGATCAPTGGPTCWPRTTRAGCERHRRRSGRASPAARRRRRPGRGVQRDGVPGAAQRPRPERRDPRAGAGGGRRAGLPPGPDRQPARTPAPAPARRAAWTCTTATTPSWSRTCTTPPRRAGTTSS